MPAVAAIALVLVFGPLFLHAYFMLRRQGPPDWW